METDFSNRWLELVLALILMDTYQVVKAPNPRPERCKSGTSDSRAGYGAAAAAPGCRPDRQGQSARRQRQRQRPRQGSDRAHLIVTKG